MMAMIQHGGLLLNAVRPVAVPITANADLTVLFLAAGVTLEPRDSPGRHLIGLGMICAEAPVGFSVAAGPEALEARSRCAQASQLGPRHRAGVRFIAVVWLAAPSDSAQ